MKGRAMQGALVLESLCALQLSCASKSFNRLGGQNKI